MIWGGSNRLTLWEKEGEAEAYTPVWAAGRLVKIVTGSTKNLDRLVAELEHLGDQEVRGHDPLITLPIVGGFQV